MRGVKGEKRGVDKGIFWVNFANLWQKLFKNASHTNQNNWYDT